MKSKPKPKERKGSQQKISMLLKNGRKQLLHAVPQNLSPDTKIINLSHNIITSLRGIGRYPLLQHLNISYNSIATVEQIRYLKQCKLLKQLNIQENPLCKTINYLFHVHSVLGGTVKINGHRFRSDMATLENWQMENGSIIYNFLLQKCIILNQAKNPRCAINKTTLLQQLLKLSQTFQKCLQNRQIQQLNNTINKNLIIKSVKSFQLSSSQKTQIQNYLLDKIIQIGSKINSQFVANLLENVEVADQDQQRCLVGKPSVVNMILKNYIHKQWENTLKTPQDTQRLNKLQKDSEIMHFRSADTALQSVEANPRLGNNYGIHFSMDAQYLRILNILIVEELSTLLSIVQDIQEPIIMTKKNIHIETDFNYLNSCQTFRQTQSVNSPKVIYNNSIILANILSVLETILKKIVFQKIKSVRGSEKLTAAFNLLSSSIKRQKINIYGQAFSKMKQIQIVQNIFKQNLQMKKLKRVFTEWKKIKSRKMNALHNIIMKKSKADNFLSTIAFAKWKMNSRTIRLQRMTSSVLLGIKIQQIPRSKKAIKLGYQRISSRTKYNF